MQFYRIVNTTLLEVAFADYEKADKTFYTLDEESGVLTVGNLDIPMYIKDVYQFAEEGLFFKEDEEIMDTLKNYARTTSIRSLTVD